MDYCKDIVLINSSEIISIVRRSLSKIDPRLVEHGERVGYIASKILSASPKRAAFDFQKLYILCVLHDIGAYKTNEIDDMLLFDSEKPFDHSLFGYIFLKNTTHLSEYAEALLYHHTDFSEMSKISCRYAGYAGMIYLADRADLVINSAKPDLSALKRCSGTRFDPELVDALLSAEERENFSRKLITGEYRAESEAIIGSLEISNKEIADYLMLLVYAIDFRSPYTVTHTADTTVMSIETGKLMGLGEHELQALHTGAFLHDIGKIAVPHEILEKPGRLTPGEYELVKRHIPEGEGILRGVVNDEICDIALRHHEKLDGSGYARGITGDKLTVPQRIVAVADILSALTQRRAYKEPFPKPKALHILNEMKADGLICPQVTDTICDNYDLILRNTEKSHDPVKTLYKNLLVEYRDKSAVQGIL